MSQTHFGFQTVEEAEKASRVRGVFDSVACRYDLMNDLMSLGLHRAWKRLCGLGGGRASGLACAGHRRRHGDLTRRVRAPRRPDGAECCTPTSTRRCCAPGVTACSTLGLSLHHRRLATPRRLPFADSSFDLVSVAFGLRNMTHKDRALAEMARVLRPGGRLLVLEFSRVAGPLQKAL
jgi:demethylmenaquinone methyltransferase/2-methoxy-6-polyprenyl-1,4-benzoquinol methylase